MKLINSKKQQLSLPEIIGQFVLSNGLEGQKAAIQMMMIMEELKQPKTEGVNIGNTVFISHYTDDKKSLLGWIANVDTEENLVNNAEQYVRYLIENGVETAFFGHVSGNITPMTQRLQKKKLGTTNTKLGKNGIYITEVKLADEKEETPEESDNAGF